MATRKNTGGAAAVPKGAEVAAFVADVKADADKALAFIAAIEIRKEADREFAANALAEVAARHDAIDAKRKAWVEPLKAVTGDIDATFRPVTKALKQAIDLLKGKIGAWDVAQAMERERLLRASAEAARAGEGARAEEAYEAAAACAAPAKGSAIEWAGEVIDAALIPREYLAPDLAKLAAVTRAAGADPGIPGWRAFPTAKIRTSRKAGEP